MAVSKSYSVDFDDALLDLEGWKNPRYNGSKLKGTNVNEFIYGINYGTLRRDKLITNTQDILYPYGPKPVIESRTTVIFAGNNIEYGDTTEEEFYSPYPDIKNHSQVNINKIILLNPYDITDIEIIHRELVDPDIFNQFIIDNLPEGSAATVKLLDPGQTSNLTTPHHVKFNRGSLHKVYSYTADTASNRDDGVFGGYGVRNNQGVLTDNLASGSTSGGGLFSFGMTTLASHSLFTSSIKMNYPTPDELKLYNIQDNFKIRELNPISASQTQSPVDGGDYASSLKLNKKGI